MERKSDPDYDPYAADIWSLGLTILTATTLWDMTSVYNLKQGVINFQTIDEKLCEARNRYSKEYISVLMKMLTKDPVRRVDLECLREIVNKSVDQLMST